MLETENTSNSTGHFTETNVARLVLSVQGEPQDSGRVEIHTDRFTIGSSSTADYTIARPDVHPIHCQIVSGAMGCYVESKTPKTWLNGRPVSEDWLKVGDKLTIGSTECVVQEVNEFKKAKSNVSLGFKRGNYAVQPEPQQAALTSDSGHVDVAGEQQRTIDELQKKIAELSQQVSLKQECSVAEPDNQHDAEIAQRDEPVEADTAEDQPPAEHVPDAQCDLNPGGDRFDWGQLPDVVDEAETDADHPSLGDTGPAAIAQAEPHPAEHSGDEYLESLQEQFGSPDKYDAGSSPEMVAQVSAHEPADPCVQGNPQEFGEQQIVVHADSEPDHNEPLTDSNSQQQTPPEYPQPVSNDIRSADDVSVDWVHSETDGAAEQSAPDHSWEQEPATEAVLHSETQENEWNAGQASDCNQSEWQSDDSNPVIDSNEVDSTAHSELSFDLNEFAEFEQPAAADEAESGESWDDSSWDTPHESADALDAELEQPGNEFESNHFDEQSDQARESESVSHENDQFEPPAAELDPVITEIEERGEESAESVADVLERWKETNLWSEDGANDVTEQSIINTPEVNESGTVEVEHPPASPAVLQSPDVVVGDSPKQESGEASVQDYMMQLLNRMGSSGFGFGDNESSEGSAPASEVTGENDLSGIPDLSESPQMLTPSEYIPRQQAPEKSASLDALRQVANQSTRQAIEVSNKRRKSQSVSISLSICLICVVVGIAMTFLSKQWTDISAIGGGVMGIGGLMCGLRFLFMGKSSKSEKRAKLPKTKDH